MIKFIAISLLAFFPALCNAQDLSAAKLQCEGTYSNYTLPDMRDISVNSIYIEISGDRVKVLGAPGFDSTYSVINRLENGLGIQLDSNKSWGGFLNRFSGQLSLTEKGEVGKDGIYKIRQSISALCSKARLLF